MKLQLKSVLIVCIVFVCVDGSVSTYGTRFYFGFLRQFSASSSIAVIVHSHHSDSVSFTISSLNDYSHFGTTSMTNPVTLNIPSSFQVRESGFAYRNLGLYISTLDSKEISVKALGYTNDVIPRMAFLVHPYVQQLTSQYIYFAVSAKDTLDTRFSQVLIIGTEDNTTVTLRPTQDISFPQGLQLSSSTFLNISSGSTHTFIIHKMQTVLVFSNNNDLTGTKVVSDKPLSVVSGHDCARVPFTTQTSDCDPLSTQIPPTVNWGREFLLPPLNGRTNGQKYKIITSENSTNITLKCGEKSAVEVFLASDGDIYDVDTSSAEYCSLLTSEPCYVGEFGFMSDLNELGDTLLITIPPIVQYDHNVTFTAFSSTAEHRNYFTILRPNDEGSSFSFIYNGNTFGPTWTSILYPNGSVAGYGYNSTFSGTVTISHTHTDGQLGVFVYGFTSHGGYGYVGGMLLEAINSDLEPAKVAFSDQVYYAQEGENVMISLNRSVPVADLPVSVCVMTNSDPSIIGDIDYVPIEQVVTFSFGETIKHVALTILDDDLVEGIEVVTLSVKPVSINTVTDDDIITVLILDNDVLQIGFSQSPVFTRGPVHDVAEHFISIISGRLQSGLRVSMELKVGSEGDLKDESLELLCVVEFSEAIRSHKLTTMLNSSNAQSQQQWTMSNISLASSITTSSVSVVINPHQALFINRTAALLSSYKQDYTTSSCLHSSTTCSQLSCTDVQPFTFAGIAFFASLAIVSCIINFILGFFYVKLLKGARKLEEQPAAKILHQDLTMYSNSLYGDSSVASAQQQLEAESVHNARRSLPKLPNEYDKIDKNYVDIYEKLKH